MYLVNRCLHDNLNNCNFVKTVLMLCVIIGHCCGFWTDAWFPVIKPSYSNEFLGNFANWLGSFHISCFTLVSGYIYYYVKNERAGGYSLKEVIINKTRRLIFPYIFVCLFWVIPINNFFFHYSILDIVYNFILGESAEQLWFLLMLFNVFILFFFLNPIFEWSGFVAFVILLFLYIVGDSLSRISSLNIFQIFSSFKFLLFFASGYYIRKNSTLLFYRGKINLSNVWLIVIYILVNYILSILSYDGYMNNSFFMKILCKLFFVLVNVNNAVIAFVILLFLADKISWQSKFFTVLHTNNFNMYLFHQQIVYIMLYFFNGLLLPEMHALINFLVSSSLSLLLSSVIRKNRMLRLCLGEK